MADFNLGGALSAFGQAIATNNYGNIGGHMQAHGQNRMQMQNQQNRRNKTAKFLEDQGADPQLVEMARSGMANEAFKIWGQQQKAQKPLTDLGRAKVDLQNQFITQQQYDAMSMPKQVERKIMKDQAGVQRYVDTGEPVFDQSGFEAEKQAQKARQGNVVLQDIDRAIAKTTDGGIPTTGMIGAGASYIPGTDAHDVSKLVDTIKANAGFDKLQAMRDASPTGGALGQVSERELALLNSAIGNLDQSQSQEQFLDNLNRVRNIYDEIVNGPNASKRPLSFENGMKQTTTGAKWRVIE